MKLIESKTDTSGCLQFDLTINPDSFKDDLINLVLNLKSKWCRERVTLKEFNGGLTNKLIGCGYDGVIDSGETILCRIYGSGTEKYIDREDEVNNMRTLSEIKLGPKVYCKFNNGICYEYLPGVIVNTQFLLNESAYSKVASLVASMHSVKKHGGDGGEYTGEGVLFKKLHELMKLVPDDYSTLICGTKEEIGRIPAKSQLQEELAFMEDYLRTYVRENNSKMVFSHNDLLLANIIYNKDHDAIYFIDYEYSGYNWQAYDIANHFNEYAGVDVVDWGLYPDKEYQLKWIRYYLAHCCPNQNSETAAERLYSEVAKFTLISHLFWGIWSIVQARYSSNDFNFADYAFIRFKEYFDRKQERISI